MPAVVRRVTLALIACLLLAPAAAHASWQSVVKDCRDGSLDSKHSLKDYTQALANLPSDVIEYTDCESLIRRAQLGSAGTRTKHTSGSGASTPASTGTGSGSGGTPGSSGPSSSSSSGSGSGPSSSSSAKSATPASKDPLATATPVQRAAVVHAIRAGAAPVQVGHEVIAPAALGGGGSPSMPPALIVLLVALGIGAVGIGGAAVAPRVRARRAR